MKIKSELKDWQVAKEMFGSNSKEICKLVKKLREKGEILPWCEGWSIIKQKNQEEDFGWLISHELLENV
jgi:hypothetical protein